MGPIDVVNPGKLALYYGNLPHDLDQKSNSINAKTKTFRRFCNRNLVFTECDEAIEGNHILFTYFIGM